MLQTDLSRERATRCAFLRSVFFCFLILLIGSVTVASAASTIPIEAETAVLTAPMVVNSDPTASGGQFVQIPLGSGDNLTDGTFGGNGEARFTVNVTEPGKYVLWARTITPSGKGKKGSFYVTSGDTKVREWIVPKSVTWKWNKVGRLNLLPGAFDLRFRQRTEGTKLDRILLTNEKKFSPVKSTPKVNAGKDQTVTFPNAVSLNATVKDDGLPSSGVLITTWTKVSGPGTVTFGNSADVDTTATFSKAGVYVLRLTANDGLLQAFDDVTITVKPSDFTIVVLPDTQYYSRDASPTFAAQTQWIVNNKDARNIVYVAHLGDCVENAHLTSEWDLADAAMSLLENATTPELIHGIPYGIAVGNHDQSPQGNPVPPSTQLYNTYFGESRFLGRTYYGGHFGTLNDNHFSLFSAGGMDFIVIYLEYDPSANPSILAWADELLKTHIDRRAIIVSHYLVEPGDPATFGVQGKAIYETLKGNANLFLMLGGHRHGEGKRTDVFNGNVVHTILSNYQERENGGDGWLRILEFSPAKNEIRVSTYSPTIDQFETDADSKFTLNYDMSINPNLPPVTRIGPDQEITLPASANLDGTITDDGLPAAATLVATWTKLSGPGTVVFGDPNAVDTTATFSEAGPYVLQLTASDGEKASSADLVVLVNPETIEIFTRTVEAESGILTEPMVIQSSGTASGGQFVVIPDGTVASNFNDATAGGPGEVRLSFDISQGGTYALWARTIALNGNSDSFYVTGNGDLIRTWPVPLSTDWRWNKVAEVFIGAGQFNVGFRHREDGTQLDEVTITNDLNFVPN